MSDLFWFCKWFRTVAVDKCRVGLEVKTDHICVSDAAANWITQALAMPWLKVQSWNLLFALGKTW